VNSNLLLTCVMHQSGKLKNVEGDYEGHFVNLKREGHGYFVNGFGDIYGELAIPP
jgi:hypothetical protein